VCEAGWKKEETAQVPSCGLTGVTLHKVVNCQLSSIQALPTMPPIYLTRHLADKERSPPLFEVKGATGYAPCPVSDPVFVALPLVKELAYSGYQANVEAFVSATSIQEKVFVGASGFLFRPRGRIPIKEPSIRFALRDAVTKDQLTRFVLRLGEGVDTSKAGAKDVITMPPPNDETLGRLMGLCDKHFPAGPDHVTPEGLYLFRFLTGVMHEFLCTHTYPAFTSEIKAQAYFEVSFGIASTRTVAPNTTYIGKGKGDGDISEYSNYFRIIKERNEASGMEVDGEEIKDDMREYKDKILGRVTTGLEDAVVVAKPSPGRASNNYGPYSAVPELPGLVLPYFEGMNKSDYIILRRVIGERFIRLLGKTSDEAAEAFENMRFAFNSVSNHTSGRALAHIFMSLDLALMAQARLYLTIQGGEYTGSVLLGAGFALFNGVKWVKAVDSEQLRKDLRSTDADALNMEKLSEKLEALRLAEHYTGPVIDPKKLETDPSELVAVFKGLKLDRITQQDKVFLDMRVQALDYRGSGFRSASNPAEVHWFISTYFTSGTHKIKKPCYIPSVSVDLEDKAFVLMTQFGPDAPSLWNTKGEEIPALATEITTETVGAKRKKTSEVDIFGNMPEFIFVSPKPLLVALADWNIVINKRAVRMQLVKKGERAGPYRNMKLSDEATKKMIWKVLIEGIAKEPTQSKDAEVVKKRKVENASFKDSFDAFFED
jgi:hypothetical protein